MNILILSAYNDDIENYASLSVKNKYEYSAKHNYDFINITRGFILDRYPAWSKIKFIKENLLSYDYVFWIDADALFMNFDIKLESFLEHNEKYDMIFNLEEWWNDTAAANNYIRFNTGVAFIKNSDFSFKFLKEVYNEKYLDGYFWEQSAIWEMYNANFLNCKTKIKLLPSKTFNCFREIFSRNELSSKYEYEQGDFICHFAGENNKHIEIKEYLKKVIK